MRVIFSNLKVYTVLNRSLAEPEAMASGVDVGWEEGDQLQGRETEYKTSMHLKEYCGMLYEKAGSQVQEHWRSSAIFSVIKLILLFKKFCWRTPFHLSCKSSKS